MAASRTTPRILIFSRARCGRFHICCHHYSPNCPTDSLAPLLLLISQDSLLTVNCEQYANGSERPTLNAHTLAEGGAGCMVWNRQERVWVAPIFFGAPLPA
jgi:hypothetical protein